MRYFYGGLLAALLCVALILPFGCARNEPLYTAGPAGADEEPGPDSEKEAEISAEKETEAPAPPGSVYVCGAVCSAGVYPITEGMRICDAIALAGGFAPDADQEWLNLAEYVSDGEKVYVYTLDETRQLAQAGAGIEGEGPLAGTAEGSAEAGASSQTEGKINLNTATREELISLPGIGEAKADAILAYRRDHGPFSSIEEIQNISGIKSGVFSKIRDLITV